MRLYRMMISVAVAMLAMTAVAQPKSMTVNDERRHQTITVTAVGDDGVRNGYFTFVDESTGNIADTVIGFDYTERSWYRDGIVYQIFPDRFRNGDP